MKRKLLFSIFLLFTYFNIDAQQIDLIGKGIYGKTSENLPLTSSTNIDSVRVGALYSWDLNASPTGVNFKDINVTIVPELKSDIIHKGTTSANVHGAYYTTLFENSDDSGININVFEDQENNMQSFYAYIYRNDPNAGYKSYSSLETVYFWKNTADYDDKDDRYGPYVYEIDINKASSPRDIKVKIPISELQADNRVAIIDITAGAETHHAEVTTYVVDPNLENSFFIGEYTLTDVPGNVDKVLVSIYSPTSEEAQALGYSNPDSFYISGVIIDVDQIYDGCTLTQGYWKTHSDCKANGPKRDETWNLIDDGIDNGKDDEFSMFFLSEKDYCDVFDTQPSNKNGKYYILAHQYIAAELNMLAGANPTAAQAAFDEATILLENYTPDQVKGNAGLEADCVRLGDILDDFNNGRIGPGHCDDEDDDEAAIEPVKQIILKDKVSIYPNPATTYGKIEFTPKQSATTTVELYNISGQKVSIIYNKKTKKGIPVLIEYNAEQFKKGLYFAVIRNGSKVYKEKISIAK